MAFFQDLTPAKIGFGVTLFVGGGFTAYALMRHRQGKTTLFSFSSVFRSGDQILQAISGTCFA